MHQEPQFLNYQGRKYPTDSLPVNLHKAIALDIALANSGEAASIILTSIFDGNLSMHLGLIGKVMGELEEYQAKRGDKRQRCRLLVGREEITDRDLYYGLSTVEERDGRVVEIGMSPEKLQKAMERTDEELIESSKEGLQSIIKLLEARANSR